MDYTCAIVEAEPLAETILRKYIGRTGFLELRWVSSSAEEALQQETVDLLFTELFPSLIDTESVFLSLVEAHENIIVTSVYPEEAWGLSRDPVAFLAKPVSFTAFTEAVEAFLEKKI